MIETIGLRTAPIKEKSITSTHAQNATINNHLQMTEYTQKKLKKRKYHMDVMEKEGNEILPTTTEH